MKGIHNVYVLHRSGLKVTFITVSQHVSKGGGEEEEGEGVIHT
jgi:hypothetical protein